LGHQNWSDPFWFQLKQRSHSWSFAGLAGRLQDSVKDKPYPPLYYSATPTAKEASSDHKSDYFQSKLLNTTTTKKKKKKMSEESTVIFVLGGPGSGKGTQCAKIVDSFGYVHFSAGDLLRQFVRSGTKEGNECAEMMQQGKIVPSSVTVNLLKTAMKESGQSKFLIDGFPRNLENRDTFLSVVGHDCTFVLFFDCPEDVLEKRLLGRAEGRADDNIETIKKRFKTYQDQTMPVIEHYDKKGMVKHVKTDVSIEEVFEKVSAFFK